MLRTTRKPGDAPPGPLRNCFRSEGVFQAEEDSSVTAVGGSFIEEPGIGDARFGDAEIARIRQVEEVDAKLKLLAFSKQPRRFRNAEIHIADPIGAQDVTAHASEAVPWGACQGRTDSSAGSECAEERTATGPAKFLDGHAGDGKVGVEVWPNGVPHQPSDTAKCCRWIRTVQHSKRCAALERQEPSKLPTSEETPASPRLTAIKRQFVNRIDRQSVRPVVGRAGTLHTRVEVLSCME